VGWLRREIVSVLAGTVTPTWRVRPAIELILWLARLQRLRDPDAGAAAA
jgi:hypothetical protein